MQLGMIRLGRMGANMVRRLLRGGHQGVVFDRSRKAVQELTQEKAVGAGACRRGLGQHRSKRDHVVLLIRAIAAQRSSGA